MAEFLIVYASVEGWSRRIALHLGDRLARAAHAVRTVDAADPPAGLDPAAVDAVVMVAPVHDGRHPDAARRFARDHAAALSARPSALVSVSLHAASGEAEDEEEARAYVDRFIAETGWRPEAVHHAGGALSFAELDFLRRFAARRLTRALEMPPPAKGRAEFTDWAALDAFLDRFAARAAAPA